LIKKNELGFPFHGFYKSSKFSYFSTTIAVFLAFLPPLSGLSSAKASKSGNCSVVFTTLPLGTNSFTSAGAFHEVASEEKPVEGVAAIPAGYTIVFTVLYIPGYCINYC